jgi:hypothetical protein
MLRQLKSLTDSLQVLAASADAQLSYLRKLGRPDLIDELALEFDDIAASADSLFSEGILNDEQRQCVENLSRYLAEFGGEANSHLWTAEALRVSDKWKRVRILASDCLSHFQVP